MKVIGVGVGRTGTLSLKAALDRLGFGPCFHMRNVLDHPERLPLWEAAAAVRRSTGTKFSPVTSRVSTGRARRSGASWPIRCQSDLDGEIPSAGTTACARRSTSCSGAAPRARWRTRPCGGSPASRRCTRSTGSWSGTGRSCRDGSTTATGPCARSSGTTQRYARRYLPNGCSSSTSAQAGDRCATSSGWTCRRGVPRLNDPAAFWGRVRDRLAEGAVSPHPAMATEQ